MTTFVIEVPDAGWGWGVDGEIWGDGFTRAEAEGYAAEHDAPELCDRCGDQGVCPECRS